MRRLCHRHTLAHCVPKRKKKAQTRFLNAKHSFSVRYFFYDKFRSFHLAPRIVVTTRTTDETKKSLIVRRALCARKSIIQSLLFG